ncbi:MAG: radical SAM protein [Deltaproteobacteria bacterium]|nr:radical SAM protein [Deltaproteobacteria bacterium]
MLNGPSKLATVARVGRWAITSRLGWRHPLHLIHAVTARCNARCGFCAWNPELYQDHDELTTAEIKQLYTDAKRAGLISVSVWGGEPLLRPDIEQIVAHARSVGLLTNMVTNGTLLERKMDRVLPYLDRLCISVDHASDKHDQIRGVPGLFNKLISATERVQREYPKTRMVFNYTVHSENVDLRSIEQMAELSRRMNVPVIFTPLRVEMAVGEHDDRLAGLNPTNEQLAKAYRYIAELKRTGTRVVTSDSYIAAVTQLPLSYRCHWPKFMLPIEANGDVVDCMHWGTQPITNLRQMPFAEALRHPRLRELTSKEGEACHKCISSHRYELSQIYEGRFGPLLSWGKNVIWNRVA